MTKGKKGERKPKKGEERPREEDEEEMTVSKEEGEEKREEQSSANESLLKRIAGLEAELAAVQASNAELIQTKTALSEEVVELTKALFEEANGMVATEIKARHEIELARRRLERELEACRERLLLESQQLGELRARLGQQQQQQYQSGSSLGLREGSDGLSETLAELTRRYQEDLMPGRRCDTRQCLRGAQSAAWEAIVGGVELGPFNAFIEAASCADTRSEDDEALLSHPFMRSLLELEVLPCLQVEGAAGRPKAFIRKLILAMLRNQVGIERHDRRGEEIRRPVEEMERPASTNPLGEGGEDLEGRGASRSNPQSPRTKLKGMFNQWARSVSSLPDLTFGGDLLPPTTGTAHYCGLCSRPISQEQDLFRLSCDNLTSVLHLDGRCRERLVALGDLFTWLRHIRRGLMANRPTIDLYFELLHWRRLLFYTRTQSCSFFIQSDAERLLGKLVKSQRRRLIESPSSLLEDSSSHAVPQDSLPKDKA